MNVHVARIVPGQIARNEARVLLDGQSRAYAAIDDLDARDDLKETLRFLAARVAANARMKLYHYRTAALADEGGFLLHFVASAFGPSLEIHVRGAEILFRSSPWEKTTRLPILAATNRQALAALVDGAIDGWLEQRFALKAG